MFIDAHGRGITYLRLSVTDRCDFRCVYCMSEEMTFIPRDEVLSLEEIARVAKIFADNGVSKFRLTGGEPLIRRDIDWLINELNHYNGVKQIALTTNGSQLPRLAGLLKQSGVNRLNISLDTLDADDFSQITRTGSLTAVLEGIATAQAVGLSNIRLNSVIMKGKNDKQILPLIDYVRRHQLDIAFIEEMPLGDVSHNREATYISSADIRQKIHAVYPLIPTLIQSKNEAGPADYWQFADGQGGKVGFISPHSCNFCADCNRLRLTVEGRLLLCLGHENSLDLREMLRSGKSDSEITYAIHTALQYKPEKHAFTVSEKPVIFRHMNRTGG